MLVYSYKHKAFCLLFGVCTFAISCKSHQPTLPVGYTIHIDYAANDPRAHVVPGKAEDPVAPKVDEDGPYESAIRQHLDQNEFDQLDDEAHQARVGKIRFIGGAWKLSSFYIALTTLPADEPADDVTWNSRLEKLKAWVSAKPESVTAQIALADAYVNYGWYARGSGTANTVPPAQWVLFNQRTALARAILEKASLLSEKCPYWYEAMQHVAQAQGWKRSEARALLEKAVSLEPGFYHFYREYARYLDPRWYGSDGEAQAFADEISDRVGGKDGAFLYFEVASLLTCQCGGDHVAQMKKFSWPRVQEGYEALDQLYGISTLKRSRFAHMAYLANDRAVTQKILLQLGDNWDEETWGSRDHFEDVRDWAVGPRPEPGKASDSVVYVSSSPRTGTDLRVGDQVSFSLTVRYDLETADAARITLVLQKDDGSRLWAKQRQVAAAINRGAGEATLTTDPFEVPPGTKKIHVFAPLSSDENPAGSHDVAFEYPVLPK